jgi:hypothetical protein
MRCLELSAMDAGGRFVGGPEFLRVWHGIEKGASAITSLRLVEPPSRVVERLGASEVAPGFWTARPPPLAERERWDILKWLSNEGGSLTVWYVTEDVTLIRAISAGWAVATDIEARALFPRRAGIAWLLDDLDRLPEGAAAFGFAHGGDPLYVFGAP